MYYTAIITFIVVMFFYMIKIIHL